MKTHFLQHPLFRQFPNCLNDEVKEIHLVAINNDMLVEINEVEVFETH